MTRYRIALILLLVLGLGSSACEKLQPAAPSEPAEARGELSLLPATIKDAIPLEYGKLVAVIPHTTNEAFVGLWFEDDEQTLTGVWVNVVEGRIYDQILQIRRR
jgi:hypothetical protein